MKQRTWIVGAVAAMLAVAPALHAQDATTPATPPATGDMSASIPAPMPMPEQIDYSVLKNQSFTYMDLKQAKARGLSDDQIASVAKIAEKTGTNFSDVAAAIERGETFPMLATQYNLGIADVYNVDDEKTKIDNYKKAYETTGTFALKAMQDNGMSSGSMSSSDTSTGSSSSATPATAPSSDTTASSAATPAGDVIDVASSHRNLSTFVRAVQAAGLTDTLKGQGPFTIFAPSNRAFSRLPRAQRQALMADPAALKNILSYHVIQGAKVDAAAAMSMTSPTSPPTVQGGTLQVTTSNGKVMINDATVTQPDIQASNGIIHIIDRVLMPAGATGTDNTGAGAGTSGTAGTGAAGTNSTGTGTDNSGAGTGGAGTGGAAGAGAGTSGTAGTGAAGTNSTGTGTDNGGAGMTPPATPATPAAPSANQ